MVLRENNGEGNGKPLQNSCLRNSMAEEPEATIQGSESLTQLLTNNNNKEQQKHKDDRRGLVKCIWGLSILFPSSLKS